MHQEMDSARHRLICQQIEDQLEPLRCVAVHKSREVGVIRWIPERQLARFEKLKNKPGWMGKSTGSPNDAQIWLNREEALFLMESGAVVMYTGEEDSESQLLLSIQEAYAMLLEDDGSVGRVNRYLVYSHLVRLGYRLREHAPQYVKEQQQARGKKEEKMAEVLLVALEEDNCDKEIEMNSKRRKTQHTVVQAEDESEVEKKCSIRSLNESDISSTLRADGEDGQLMSLYRFIRQCKHFYDDQDTRLPINQCWPQTKEAWIRHESDQSTDASLINFEYDFNVNQSIIDPTSSSSPRLQMFGDQNDCVRKIGDLLTQDQLFDKMQRSGPICETNLFSFSPASFAASCQTQKYLPDYDIFRPETDGSLKREPDLYLKILDNQDHDLPLDEVLALNANLPDSDRKLVFVIIDRGEITFHQFNTFQF